MGGQTGNPQIMNRGGLENPVSTYFSCERSISRLAAKGLKEKVSGLSRVARPSGPLDRGPSSVSHMAISLSRLQQSCPSLFPSLPAPVNKSLRQGKRSCLSLDSGTREAGIYKRIERGRVCCYTVSRSWLTRSVWPLDWGWNPKERLEMVPNWAQNSFQNAKTNCGPRSDTMSAGMPCILNMLQYQLRHFFGSREFGASQSGKIYYY